ncbi:MAG: UPF0104 family protein [Acidobacteria bacterium]|nr:MAG: UPF0104 family protein [Acidobacteriota bacterium]
MSGAPGADLPAACWPRNSARSGWWRGRSRTARRVLPRRSRGVDPGAEPTYRRLRVPAGPSRVVRPLLVERFVRRVFAWLTGPLLAALFLWLCFRNVELERLGPHLREADPLLLAACLASVPVHIGLRAWRWRTLLGASGRAAPFRELASAIAIGYMASLLPGRVGEVLRPALLARRSDVPFGTALATVGVERAVLDVLAVLGLGGLGLALPGRWSGLGAATDAATLSALRRAGLLALAAALAGLVLVSAAARARRPLAARLERLTRDSGHRPLRALAGFAARLLPGVAAFETLPGILRLAAETLVLWIVIAAGIHAGVAAAGVSLAPGGSLILLPILAAGIGIPTPGGAGSYHYAMMLGLTRLFGASRELALSTGLVVHAATIVPMLVLGGLSVALGGLAGRRAVEVEP